MVGRTIKKTDCLHSSGGKDPCHVSSNPYIIGFGAIQIIFSQIPDFHKMWWLSIVAAVMSFTYSIIGLALGIAKVSGYVPASILIQVIFQFLADILFSWFLNRKWYFQGYPHRSKQWNSDKGRKSMGHVSSSW